MHFVVSSNSGALLGGLDPFAVAGVPVVDEERQHLAVALEEGFEVDDEVLQDRQAADRLDGHLRGDLPNEDLACQDVATVDHHRVGSADPVGARPPQRQGAVVVPLHLVQRIEQPVERVGLDLELVPPGVGPDLAGCSA